MRHVAHGDAQLRAVDPLAADTKHIRVLAQRHELRLPVNRRDLRQRRSLRERGRARRARCDSHSQPPDVGVRGHAVDVDDLNGAGERLGSRRDVGRAEGREVHDGGGAEPDGGPDLVV